MLQRTVQRPTASPEAGIETLESLLGGYHFALDETVPLLADLLGLRLPPERYAPLSLTPQAQRQETLHVLLVVIEDLHWADPSTLEFLELLIAQVASASMLVVLTCRPTFEVPWHLGLPVTLINLERLTQGQAAQNDEPRGGG